MKGRWFANDDISINVLSRLSTKTLHLLKLVSKDWLNLISDRSFITLQLKRSEPFSGFFFQGVFEWTDDEDIESISFIPIEVERVNVWRSVLDFLPDYVVILSLNKGLLCCRSSFPSSDPMIYVCNPLNKQWRSLMWPNLPKNCSVALVFDPFRDPIDISTDFTLVAVSRIGVGRNGVVVEEEEEEEEEEEYSFFFDIYSSKTLSWRRSNECCRYNRNLTKNRGALIDGILYWLTDGYEVLMFDHQTELSWLIAGPLPPTEFTCIPEMCIGESQGKLHYVIISEHGLQLWILDDHFAPKWDLRFYATLDNLESEYSDVLYNVEPKITSRLSRHTNPWVDPLSFKDGMVLIRISVAVYLYQFDTRRMKKLCDVSTLGPTAMFSPIIFPYTMSLVPVEQG